MVMIGSSLLAVADDGLRVLSVRGEVSARIRAKEIAVKAGASLPNGSQVIVGRVGHVALLSSKGMMRELHTAGTYKTDTIFIDRAVSSTFSRVAKYVYDNSFASQQIASDAGTVYRAQMIVPVWPPNIMIDTASVTVSWLSIRGFTGSYEVVIRDDNDSVIHNQKLSDTSFTIGARVLAQSYQGRCIYWSVQQENDAATASKPRCVTLASVDNRQDLASQLQELRSVCQSNQEQSAVDLCKLLIAALYEEQGFYDRALREYASCSQANDESIAATMLKNCLQRGRE